MNSSTGQSAVEHTWSSWQDFMADTIAAEIRLHGNHTINKVLAQVEIVGDPNDPDEWGVVITMWDRNGEHVYEESSIDRELAAALKLVAPDA